MGTEARMAGQKRSLTLVVVVLALLTAVGMIVMHAMVTSQASERRGRRVKEGAKVLETVQEEEKPKEVVEEEKPKTVGEEIKPHQEKAEEVQEEKKLTRPDLPHYPPYLSLAEREGGSEGVLFRDTSDGTYDTMKWRTISHSEPRCMYIEKFWTDDEADLIVKFAEMKIQRSTVVGGKNGEGKTNDVRTSKGMFITDPNQATHPVVMAARKRVELITGLAEENIEATQVLRYEGGERYLAHPDYFQKMYKNHLARGGQRVATMLSWVADTKSGGNTSFPMSKGPDGKPYTVKPKKGDAIVFWDCQAEQTEDGFCEGDPYSQHQAHPPDEGSTKWVAVFWIRQRKFT